VDDVVRKYEAESRFRKVFRQYWKTGRIHLYRHVAVPSLYSRIRRSGSNQTTEYPSDLLSCSILLLYPSGPKGSSNRTTLWDWILVSLSVAVGVYLMVIYDDLANRGGVTVPMDIYMGGLLCLLVLEAARRATGKELPIMALCFVAYALFGDLIPGQFGHRGYSLERVIDHMFLTTEGIYGVALGVSATYIYLFILFGAFLDRTGLEQFFIDISMQ